MSAIEEEMMLATEEQVAGEVELYHKVKIASNVAPTHTSISIIKKRTSTIIIEGHSNLAFNIFLIKLGETTLVGRKLISERTLKGELRELNCSLITSSMLLGIFVDAQTTESHQILFYKPFTPGERLTFFEYCKNELKEIVYPFIYLTEEGKERTSPLNGWSLNPFRASNLGVGEKPLRDFTIAYLKKMNTQLDGKILYDPACSTGEFLWTLKKEFPQAITIGQDLSQQMINYAQAYVDEAYCCDAISNPIEKKKVDLAFIRFLNSEVVTTAAAYKLFSAIAKRVKYDGYIFIIGHTPILLRSEYFRLCGFSIQNYSGYSEEHNSIFQYYVLKKEKEQSHTLDHTINTL